MSDSPDRDRPRGDHFNGTYVPVEEPSTASEAEITPALFDHLVGADHERRWKREPERFCRLGVENQFDLRADPRSWDSGAMS
jgi:hypothetical protein